MGTLLVCYDIPDDRRRARVARVLEQLGTRLQLSVFLIADRPAAEVAQRLRPLLETEEDDLRIQPLCASCAAKPVLLGRARPHKEPSGYSVI